MTADLSTFAGRLRASLDEAGVSVPKLVQSAPDGLRGASQNSIYRYLRGDRPPAGFVRWAARELGVMTDWLHHGTPPRYPGPVGPAGSRRSEQEAAFAGGTAIRKAIRDAGLDPLGPAGQAVSGIVLRLQETCSPEHLPAHETLAAAVREIIEMIDAPVDFFERAGGGVIDREAYTITAAAALAHLLPREASGVRLADLLSD